MDKVYCLTCKFRESSWDMDDTCLRFIKREYDNWFAHHRIYGLCKKKNKHNDCPDYEVIHP